MAPRTHGIRSSLLSSLYVVLRIFNSLFASVRGNWRTGKTPWKSLRHCAVCTSTLRNVSSASQCWHPKAGSREGLSGYFHKVLPYIWMKKAWFCITVCKNSLLNLLFFQLFFNNQLHLIHRVWLAAFFRIDDLWSKWHTYFGMGHW